MSAILALPPATRASEQQVGVIAMLLGIATVTRGALPAPAPLKFKDDVLLRDRITTGERSAVRVLLGGKATVTARERSILTITEVPGTSTVSFTAGRAAVAVIKARMKPGETVEIKTPNAIVAVRGTLVIVEVSRGRSTITILRGLVEVTKLDPATGRTVGPAVKVGARERVIVIDAGPVPAPQTITPEAAKSLAADFAFLPKDAPSASVAALNQEAKKASISGVTQTLGGVSTPVISTLTGGGSATTPPILPGGSIPSTFSPTITPDGMVPIPFVPPVPAPSVVPPLALPPVLAPSVVPPLALPPVPPPSVAPPLALPPVPPPTVAPPLALPPVPPPTVVPPLALPPVSPPSVAPPLALPPVSPPSVAPPLKSPL